MEPLLQKILEAHGGLDRWQKFDTVSARLRQGGALWSLKGHGGKLDDVTVTVSLREELASHRPFGAPERMSWFTPDQVDIQTVAGRTIESLRAPRNSFASHTLETPWTELQLAYFAGCAMWTYFNVPFVLAQHDIACQEIDTWQENGETWRRLRVNFPDTIATHSKVQTLYVGDDGLLRRHDYDVDIAGGTPGAHYVSGYVEVLGIQIPTRRRIYPRNPEGQALTDPLVVSIDIDKIRLY